MCWIVIYNIDIKSIMIFIVIGMLINFVICLYFFMWINWLKLFRLWFSFFSSFMGIIGFKKYVWEKCICYKYVLNEW